jgi:hypothetical protein
MRSLIPTFKTVMNAQVLFITSLLGHHLAGGEFVSSFQLYSLLAATFIALSMSGSQVLSGPGLALRIIVIQSFGHFILGGGDKSSEALMLIAHVSMGFLSYFLISNTELFWQSFVRLLDYFRPTFFSHLLVYEAISDQDIPRQNYYEKKLLFWLTKNFRGPPLEREAKHAS